MATKQIYLQLDTNSLKLQAIINFVRAPSAPITFKGNQVLAHTMINESGSMTLGSAVQTFTTKIVGNTSLWFTIVPLQLFTTDELAFNYDNDNIPEGYSKVPYTPLLVPNHQISLFETTVHSESVTNFQVTVNTTEPVSLEYKIHVNLTATDINEGNPIEFTIDPKLKAQPK